MTGRGLLEPARLAGASLLRMQCDERLVDLVRNGQDSAFEALVARYRSPLLRHCRRLLPDARAEDAVQQAFMNAYQAMRRSTGELNLSPWLHRIAHNTCLNALRQNGFGHEEISVEHEAHDSPPDVAVEHRQTLQQALSALAALPSRQRDALVLHQIEGRSYEETAVALGVSDGAVRQLLSRGRQTLRAGASALTPVELLERVMSAASTGPPLAVRIDEAVAGAGASASLAKAAAVLLVTGAVAGGVASGPTRIPGEGRGGSEPSRLIEPEAAHADTGAATSGVASPISRARAEGRSRRGEPDGRASGPRSMKPGSPKPEGSRPDGLAGRERPRGHEPSTSGRAEDSPDTSEAPGSNRDGDSHQGGGERPESTGSGSGDPSDQSGQRGSDGRGSSGGSSGSGGSSSGSGGDDADGHSGSGKDDRGDDSEDGGDGESSSESHGAGPSGRGKSPSGNDRSGSGSDGESATGHDDD